MTLYTIELCCAKSEEGGVEEVLESLKDVAWVYKIVKSINDQVVSITTGVSPKHCKAKLKQSKKEVLCKS